MKVHQLIEMLQRLPADADVGYVCEGYADHVADCVYLAESGRVLICQSQEQLEDRYDWPADAKDNDAGIGTNGCFWVRKDKYGPKENESTT